MPRRRRNPESPEGCPSPWWPYQYSARTVQTMTDCWQRAALAGYLLSTLSHSRIADCRLRIDWEDDRHRLDLPACAGLRESRGIIWLKMPPGQRIGAAGLPRARAVVVAAARPPLIGDERTFTVADATMIRFRVRPADMAPACAALLDIALEHAEPDPGRTP